MTQGREYEAMIWRFSSGRWPKRWNASASWVSTRWSGATAVSCASGRMRQPRRESRRPGTPGNPATPVRQYGRFQTRGVRNPAKIPPEWRDAEPALKRRGTAADGSEAAHLNCYLTW